jgi:phosphoribosylformylglycinamidine cyclo-ligase
MSVFDTPVELGGHSIGDELLRVHRSYLGAIRALKDDGLARGLSHVTGGGIIGNTDRILRDGLTLDIDWGSWPEPPVFEMIRTLGSVPEADMQRTFNLGVGLVAVVSAEDVDQTIAVLSKSGHAAFTIGSIIST